MEFVYDRMFNADDEHCNTCKWSGNGGDTRYCSCLGERVSDIYTYCCGEYCAIEPIEIPEKIKKFISAIVSEIKGGGE